MRKGRPGGKHRPTVTRQVTRPGTRISEWPSSLGTRVGGDNKGSKSWAVRTSPLPAPVLESGVLFTSSFATNGQTLASSPRVRHLGQGRQLVTSWGKKLSFCAIPFHHEQREA